MTTDADVRAELERALGAPLAAFARRPSPSRTSFELDELDVVLADGTALALLRKDLSPAALEDAARAAKPSFLLDPDRELAMYRDVLGAARIGAPALHGIAAERRWLFIERVAGVELFQVGARATWEDVARWLRRTHAALAPFADAVPSAIRYDERYLRTWPARALAFARERGDREATAAIAAVAGRYDAVVERLLALPATLIHGELYASNVLVDRPERPTRVAAVDWEQAAIGPALVDLAALTSGRWAEHDRAAMVAAYCGGPPDASAEEGLAACRTHVAMQWLGWSATWVPPAEHRHDWLAEAVRASAPLIA